MRNIEKVLIKSNYFRMTDILKFFLKECPDNVYRS